MHPTHHFPPPFVSDGFSVSPAHGRSRRGSSHEHEAGVQRDYGLYNMLDKKLRATGGPAGSPQWQQRKGGTRDEREHVGGTGQRTRSNCSRLARHNGSRGTRKKDGECSAV